MIYKTLLILPLLILVTACTASSVSKGVPADEPDRPKAMLIPGHTAPKVRRGKSEPFELGEVSIDDDTLNLEVSCKCSDNDHSFDLFWDGWIRTSNPVQIWVVLKHTAATAGQNTDSKHKVSFKLHKGIDQPALICIHTDHGEETSIMYGKDPFNF